MAGRGGPLTVESGRRGYLRYLYGTHYWIPEVQADWSRGIIRDVARDALPPGSVYDSADYLLHQPGVAQKRGGTVYAGPALTGSNYAPAVAFAEFPAGSQLVAIGQGAGAADNHLYQVTAGTTTDKGQILAQPATLDTPKLRIGGTVNLLIIPSADGTTGPSKYDGSAAPAALAASAPAGRFCAIYKSRIALANSTANPERIYFSPALDPTTTWDTANSWLPSSYSVTGLAALNNVLLVFSRGHMERIIGSTPPPNTDMDLAPVAGIGCSDARSIVAADGYCYFANPRGVYVTNGTQPVSLTKQGGIESFWQSLFSGYDPATWFLSAGMIRSYLIVCVLDNARNLVATLMCNTLTRAWWRCTNIRATMFATATGVNDELYYADASTNRIVALSGIFTPQTGNKLDANGTAVQPTLEFAPFGQGTGVKAYGFGHLNFDMRDAANDNPTMIVTLKAGTEADTVTAAAESPLTETTTLTRPRFTIAKEAQAVTIALAQTGASSKTELYALEVESRSQPLTGEGVS